MNREENEPTEEDLLMDMTKAINVENVDMMERMKEQVENEEPKRGRGRPKGSRSRSQSPAPVVAMAPATPAPSTPIQVKSASKPDAADISVLRFKIKCFLGSPYMKEIITEDIKEMPEKTVNQCVDKLKSISQCRNLNFKKSVVGKLFGVTVGLFEEGTKFYLPYMDGFAEDCEVNKHMFEGDLEELAIDMGDYWVPGPTQRILASLCLIMNERRKHYYTFDPNNADNAKTKLKSVLKKQKSVTPD